MTITLYDIPCKLEGVAWNPHVWKVRYCLNLKGIAYKTEWLEYPEIAPRFKELGIKPTATKPDGSPFFSVPAIHDDSTGVYVADSLAIAEYLEKTYPDAPSIFLENTIGLQSIFDKYFYANIGPLPFFIVPASFELLNSASQKHYEGNIERIFGKKVSEMRLTGKAKEQEWAAVKDAFGKTAELYAKTAGKGPFLLGETPSWADFVVAGSLHSLWKFLGVDSEEWKDFLSWHDGCWTRLLKGLKPYDATVL